MDFNDLPSISSIMEALDREDPGSKPCLSPTMTVETCSGVYWLKRLPANGGRMAPVWLCSPMIVTKEGNSKTVRLKHSDGNESRLTFSGEFVPFSNLRRAGLIISHSPTARERISKHIKGC